MSKPRPSHRLPPGSRFVLIGDSITDAGRDASGEPTPWNRSTNLGSGYVSFVNSLLESCHPEMRPRIFNKGVSGHTIRDLSARWTTDVLDLEPDWLSICIGINDVWRQFDCSLATDRHVLPEEFEETYRRLLDATRPRLAGLVLMTPFVIDANREDPMRRQMDRYGGIVTGLAREYDAAFVDTQSVFDRLMRTIPPTELAWDRIHPGPTGHMALALALLDAIGFSWKQGPSCGEEV